MKNESSRIWCGLVIAFPIVIVIVAAIVGLAVGRNCDGPTWAQNAGPVLQARYDLMVYGGICQLQGLVVAAIGIATAIWVTLFGILVIVADVWHTVPFVALILQAALASLPPELEEAAAVDGANAFKRFWLIRMPLLRPAILVALVIRTVEAFRVFDMIYVMTGGGPAFGTVTISYLTYINFKIIFFIFKR